ncbi:MAG: winged helix DNA-binding domain-containing protein [Planctomycetes bacterium]|nr:winged helix DNA-binding domain-containing protein [Planctomycetota bacterium]MCH9723662.1 winged helix DNA-binding domain-containing protein [Planctomycetota bacterium]MCH9778480.1 winged helix DNA-binding domain-containing protein [Planctomycetota bacterium]MCH9791560.1 winged helix DNA-binding domain-containing protein [Planctomycetota bacterium]
MKTIQLPLKSAQRLMVASQQLAGPALEPVQIIEHLGYVQIDTISVVERAHHHVFWSRNQKYSPADLSHLVESRDVFEYWSHAASYLPMKDYRYSLLPKKEFQKREASWFPRDLKLMKQILKRIEKEGPLRSKDFEMTKQGKSGWWDWKPAKKALERLFLEGKLEITRREGFQKVYDLPENVIPSSVDTTLPSETDYARYLIQRTLQHHGLATGSEMSYMRKSQTKTTVLSTLKEMVSAGEITPVSVAGVEQPYYALKQSLENIPRVSPKVHILSPFDNLIIQRKKLLTFFDYDYKIECYVPAPKRKYGYFSLPVLQGSRFVARIDCKADRPNQRLMIQSIHYEKNVDQRLLQKKMESKLLSFAKFNGCNALEFNIK